MPRRTHTQRGLSLVELMIAMVLGLIVVGAVVQIFLGSHQAYRMNEALARNQENARYAMEVLANDIRMAGNMGCQSRLVRETPDREGNLAKGTFRVTLNDPGSYTWSFQDGIQGYHWTGGGWSPALPSGTAPVVDNSDVLTLRGSRYLGLVVEDHPGGSPPGSADIKVNAPNSLAQKDILIVGDCTSAAIFQITNVNPGTTQNIVHNTGGSTSPGNWTKALGRSFVGADVMQLWSTIYFLRTNPAGQPALYRRVNNGDAEELVAGIERMRFEYGLDPTGGTATQVEELRYANAIAANDWDQVLSVRINLLMVSAENNLTTEAGSIEFAGETIDLTDRRLRQVVTSTVALRNRLQ